VYTTLLSAQAASPSANLLYLLNFLPEGVVFAKIIYTLGFGPTAGQLLIAEEPTYYRGNNLTVTSGGFNPTNHSTLSNRTDVNSHPASAISLDTTNFNLNLSAANTTVQSAIETLDDLVAAAGGALTVTGTRASPSNIVAGTGIAYTGSDARQLWMIQGNAAGINDVSANPQIAAGAAGRELILIGCSDANTVLLEDGTGLSLNGPI
jgi:hypothetical protein